MAVSSGRERMEILSVVGCPYEDYDGQVLELHVRLEDDEVVLSVKQYLLR